MCRCGAQGHGLVVDLAVLGMWLDSMILKFFSSLNGSMILLYCVEGKIKLRV